MNIATRAMVYSLRLMLLNALRMVDQLMIMIPPAEEEEPEDEVQPVAPATTTAPPQTTAPTTTPAPPAASSAASTASAAASTATHNPTASPTSENLVFYTNRSMSIGRGSYHSDRSCSSFLSCKTGVARSTESHAVANGLKPCKLCYN